MAELFYQSNEAEGQVSKHVVGGIDSTTKLLGVTGLLSEMSELQATSEASVIRVMGAALDKAACNTWLR